MRSVIDMARTIRLVVSSSLEVDTLVLISNTVSDCLPKHTYHTWKICQNIVLSCIHASYPSTAYVRRRPSLLSTSSVHRSSSVTYMVIFALNHSPV